MNDEEVPHAVLAIRTRKPVVINMPSTMKDEPQSHEKWGIRSVLVVPLVTKDEFIGVHLFQLS